MKIENIGNKIIGIGEVTVLPSETKEIPKAYETSPILEVYKQCGAARIIGTPPTAYRNTLSDEEERTAVREAAAKGSTGAKEKAAAKESTAAKEKAAAKKKAESEKKADIKEAEGREGVVDEAEALRQTRLAMLNGISEEGLIKLAGDLGINFAECKDSADMLVKVEEVLKK